MLLSLNVLAANKPAARPTPLPSPEQATHVSPAPILLTMGQELDREMPILSRSIPPAYFINYTLTSTQSGHL
jgi:hypothetical protein